MVAGVITVAARVMVYWFAGSEGESAPDDAAAKGVIFTDRHLDAWSKGNISKWKVTLQRYASDLSGRNGMAVANLLDPADKISAARIGSVVSKFSAGSVVGIRADLIDYEYPDYSRFCLRYPDGTSQEVFVTCGVPGGSDKKWVLRLEDADKESC